jgi:MFS transporter, ACDE family, multidrug resistance protein
VVVVHVPESAVVGGATASDADRGDPGLDRSVAAAREALGREGTVTTETPAPVGDHVGAELADLARRRGARAVVVGPPRGGALAALTTPCADRALWTQGPCPVVVVPDEDVAPTAVGR